MSNFGFPETKLRSQNPGHGGPLFTMTLDEILGKDVGAQGSSLAGAGGPAAPPSKTFDEDAERTDIVAIDGIGESRKSRLAGLPGVTFGDRIIVSAGNTVTAISRDQILGAMVAGAEAGAQHIVDTTPELVLGSLGAVGANVITGAAERVANTQPILHFGNQILTKELQSPPPSHPELTASRSAEDLQRLIEELNASPLMHIPEELAEGGDRHPLAPHVYVAGFTLGELPQALMRPGMPTGAFLLYSPEREYLGSFHPVPLRGGPITSFGDLVRGGSAGGVFTVPAYDSENTAAHFELGPGGVVKFELPGGIEGLVFVNARVAPAELAEGNVTISVQGGVVINVSSLTADGLQLAGRVLQTVPKPGVIAAGRAIEGTGTALGFIDDHVMSYLIGGGYRMEFRFRDGEFDGVHIGGQRVELEDIVEQLLTHSDHFDTPPLIPAGGNPVIEAHNNRMQMAYGRTPFDIAYDLQDQPTENSAVQIAQRFNAFIENTMRPNAHLLSEGLQRRINLPLTSVNDFGPIYDDFAREVEALGMGHLRDDIGLANPYAIDGGSIALNYANLAAYARLQASGGLGDLSVEEAMRLGILPGDFLETRTQLLGQPEFDEHDPSHSPGGWIELFYQ